MKTKTKIITGAAIALVLLIFVMIGVAVGGWYYIGHRLQEPKLRAKLDKAWDDGEAFGKTTDQNGCMTKGLLFTDSADSFDLSNNDFDHACLSACRKSPGFCDGVKLDFGGHWPDNQCEDRKQNKEACITAFERKQFFCRIEKGL